MKKTLLLLVCSLLALGQALSNNSTNVTIVAGGTNIGVNVNVVGATVTYTPTTLGAQIGADDIVANLNNGNNVVIITTTATDNGQQGDILVASAIVKTMGANANITMTAAGAILVNANITNIGAGGITLKANLAGTTTGNFIGIFINNVMVSTGSGAVIVNGTGGAAEGGSNHGVSISTNNAKITSGGGNVSVTGQGGGSGSSIFNVGVFIESGAEITAGGMGTVTVNGTGGAGGGNNNYGVFVLGSNSKITSVGGAIFVIGQGGNGAADILLSDGTISSTAATAGILLDSKTNGTFPNTAGTDVGTDATQTTAFAAGSKLNILINGLTPNTATGYQQLGVVGMINLTDVELTFNGSTHMPSAGNTFIIVDNDGNDPVIGTFQGLPEGAAIPNFLGSSLEVRITYFGGGGNDVVLFVCPMLEVEFERTTTICSTKKLALADLQAIVTYEGEASELQYT